METKTSIGIKFELEGFHSFPNASGVFGKSVEFLQYPHRHIFKFECKKKVNHDNRDEEFILLMRRVKAWVKQSFSSEEIDVFDFKELSCESIAKLVLNEFNFDSVMVSEDGENYALVEKEEQIFNIQTDYQEVDKIKIPLLPKKKFIFVVGQAFSGKSTYIKRLKNKYPKVWSIEVGDVVREIKNTHKRIFDKELDKEIAQRIYFKVKTSINYPCEEIYIVGCRQESLFNSLKNIFEKDGCKFDYEFIVLTIPKNIRFERFCRSKDDKNKDLSFEDIEQGEKEIGLIDFINSIINNYYEKTFIINENICDATNELS